MIPFFLKNEYHRGTESSDGAAGACVNHLLHPGKRMKVAQKRIPRHAGRGLVF